MARLASNKKVSASNFSKLANTKCEKEQNTKKIITDFTKIPEIADSISPQIELQKKTVEEVLQETAPKISKKLQTDEIDQTLKGKNKKELVSYLKDIISTTNVKNPKTDIVGLDGKSPQELFGRGFEPREYIEMNELLQKLKNSYAYDRSAMHEEALVTYVKLACKRNKAIMEDNVDEAEKWGRLASKQATDAKINPSQLSAADLSEGINNFSKISEAIEKVQDIIPILPRFVQGPLDALDYEIWQRVNYTRRLQGLGEVEYKDVYGYLAEAYERNKEHYPFLKLDAYGDYDNNTNVGF